MRRFSGVGSTRWSSGEYARLGDTEGPTLQSTPSCFQSCEYWKGISGDVVDLSDVMYNEDEKGPEQLGVEVVYADNVADSRMYRFR